MSARFEEMKDLLVKGKLFKLICGAGNEDADEVRRLSTLYTLAGSNCFDVSATPRIVEACVEGINTAYEMSKHLGITITTRPSIMVSVGMHRVRTQPLIVW